MTRRILIFAFFVLLVQLSFAQLIRKQNNNDTISDGKHYEATFYTSEGVFRVKLHNETPIHRDNFVKLARSDFYKGIIFHRVIKDFMIQAGDPSSREGSEVRTYGNNDSGYKLPAEIVPEFFHKKGVLAAAREGDDGNPERKSSGSQFYVVVGNVFSDSTMNEMQGKMKQRGAREMTPEVEAVYRKAGGTPQLDGLYTIFGEVISGQNVVDKINAIPTYKNDRPKKDAYIKSIIVEVVKDSK
ncbi:Peptidyl-prolyl cis-trans isomerase [Mucinivorans hirudinis]|uniref:Peptidyl-prolyl cis-trans isomerase n=1 Tax=Mucinivorans hirudinis TaxID=1433126 RepID=A0A060R5Z3_9BACT|nr:Peptidyl-prolyl cis-trans isomerase [Mucinivorans hirudinis]